MSEAILSFIPWLLIGAFWVFVVRRNRGERSDNGGATDADLRALQERVRQLEEAQSATEISLSELTEAQRFTSDLLMEAKPRAELPPEGRA